MSACIHFDRRMKRTYFAISSAIFGIITGVVPFSGGAGVPGCIVGNGPLSAPQTVTNAMAVSIKASGSHALALLDNGRVFAWGNNSYGQTNVPADLTNVIAIAAGGFHSLALRADGTVASWGRFTLPSGFSNVVAIAAGLNSSLLLFSDGTVWP